jgi:hypothetical protein
MKEVALIGAALAACASALIIWAWSGTDPAPRDAGRPAAGRDGPVAALFVGDRACAECHPGESASHRSSGHSQTLRLANEGTPALALNGRTARDEEFDGVWDYALRDGSLVARRTEADRLAEYVLDYAFGSGHHATTFVSMTDRTPSRPRSLEHRMTYFARDRAIHATPGQAMGTRVDPGELTPDGRAHGPEKTLECFGCHSTLLAASGRNELDLATMIPNVGCERCHGPGRGHIEAARRGAGDLSMPFGPGGSTADLQMRHCGGCHRHPDMAPAGAIRPDNLEIVRYQPVGLMQSKCYTRTPGGLSCTTCHDPHSRASSNLTTYEASCLACHSARPQAICPVSQSTGCVSCHMPARDAGQGIMFHDHWIRTHPAPTSPPE